MKNKLAASMLAGLCLFAAATAGEPERLFQDEAPLRLEIRGPLRTLIRNADGEPSPYAAMLSIAGAPEETHAIELTARGNSRRDKNICQFPPLRVEFTQKPDKASVFDDQKRLKLVTHCRNQAKFQQYYLLEYTAYRLLNALTPASLRVRLALIDYIDEDKEKVIATRYGFFIEDVDDAAKRNDLREIDVADADLAQIDAEAGALYSVFQYMIGNLDWSMHNPPPDSNCCHNTRLLAAKAAPDENMIPVPYDFDYSGFVDSPYALPPDGINVRSVRSRRYRGFCVHNAPARAALAAIRTKRAELYATLDGVPGMEEKTAQKARKYLDSFFADIETAEAAEKNLFSDCRS